MSDAPEVMNVRQAAHYMGISTDTLYRYLAEETIPGFKLGKRWKFKKTVLDRWMEQQSMGRATGVPKARAARSGQR
jgi:excisionase family DNA binding protein